MCDEKRERQSEFHGQWAVVELFGHNKNAGCVSEVQTMGGTMLKVETPETEKNRAFVRYHHRDSVFGVLPCSEDDVRGFLNADKNLLRHIPKMFDKGGWGGPADDAPADDDQSGDATEMTEDAYVADADVTQEAAYKDGQPDLFDGDTEDTEDAPAEITIDGEIHQLVPITEEPDTGEVVVDANGEAFEIDEITVSEDGATSFALTPLGDENPSETVTFDDLKECFRLAEPTGKQSAELSIEDLHKGDTIRLIEDMGAYPVGAEFNVIEAALDTGKVTCTEIVGDAPDAVLSGDGQPFVVDADHISTLFLKVSDQN